MISRNYRKLRKVLRTFLYISLALTVSAAQNELDVPQFFEKVNTSYYALSDQDISNFSGWVTSDSFDNRFREIFKQEIYPFEIVWVKPNDFYFIKRPLPVMGDSMLQAKAESMCGGIQKELQILLSQWNRFYWGKLLANMPPDYHLHVTQDTVILNFKLSEYDEEIDYTLIFNMKGICLKIIAIDSMTVKKSIIFPSYKYTGEYWLCTDWKMFVYQRGRLEKEVTSRIISQRLGKYWLPEKINTAVKADSSVKYIFSQNYYLRNVQINRDIQVIRRNN